MKKGGKMAVGGKAVKIASTCRQGKDDVRRRKHVGIRQQVCVNGRIFVFCLPGLSLCLIWVTSL